MVGKRSATRVDLIVLDRAMARYAQYLSSEQAKSDLTEYEHAEHSGSVREWQKWLNTQNRRRNPF